MTGTNQELPGRWGMCKRDFGTALWIAFLGACLGSFVIFALLDPEALNEAWVLPWEMGSRLAYSLGFLFLYLVSLFASGLTIFMIRTGPRRLVPSSRNPRQVIGCAPRADGSTL